VQIFYSYNEQFDFSFAFNRPWSVLGAPCLNLPCGVSAGLPLGVQLVTRRGADLALLERGGEAERLLQHDRHIPA